MPRVADISVVIPLYNKREYVRETLDSVLRQNPTPREIIIVDDGSTDGGVGVVLGMAIDGLRVVSTQCPRSGPSAARNVGILEAQCEFVAFLDADDLWAPDYLAVATSALAQLPECDGFFSEKEVLLDGIVKQEHGVSGGTRVVDANDFLAMWIARQECPLWTSASVFRRSSLLKSGGFLEAYRRGEDKELWLRIILSAKMAYSPRPLALYRRGIDGQLTTVVPDDVPPVTFTALEYASRREYQNFRVQLELVSNITLWHYAKINRGKRPMKLTCISLFRPYRNPMMFIGSCLIFAAGRAKSVLL